MIDKRPVWAVFAFEDLKPGASALLLVPSFFDPDSIPEDIFTDTIQKQSSQSSMLSGFPQTIFEYMDARTELTKCSLVHMNSLTKQLLIHRLVQDFAISSIPTQRLIDGFKTTLSTLSEAWLKSSID